VIMLLGRPYEVTAALGLELAEKRWSSAAPSLPLLLGLATAVYAPARRRAHGWIDEARALVLADAAFLAKIVLAPHADTREVARRILRSLIDGGALESRPELLIAAGRLVVDSAVGLVAGLLDATGAFQTTMLPTAVFGSVLGVPFYTQAAVWDAPSAQLLTSNAVTRIFSL
jgi:hypothetical protein